MKRAINLPDDPPSKGGNMSPGGGLRQGGESMQLSSGRGGY